MKRLLLIDGHSLAFRAFYALPVDNFATSTGQFTNAVHGFVMMLTKLLDQEEPTHIAVAFDVGRETFRTREYPQYKGTRDATPPEFKPQIPLIKELLDALKVRYVEKEDYEADDIVATLATDAEADGFDEVLICSGDRDTLQLVTARTTVIYPTRGVSTMTRYTPQAVEAKYGVTPERYPELAALVGESSDNLRGVVGVGEKTAAKWLARFDGLDSLISRADEAPGKAGQNFRDQLSDVLRNRKLNRLVTDLPLPVTLADLALEEIDPAAVHDVCDALEFNTLRERILSSWPLTGEGEADQEPRPVLSVSQWAEDGDLQAFLGAHGEGRLALAHHDVDTGTRRLALATTTHAIVLDLAELPPEEEALLGAFLAGDHPKVAHDAKRLTHTLAEWGFTLNSLVFDTDIAAYLIHPDQRRRTLADLAQRYLQRELDTAADTSGQLALDLEEDADVAWLAEQAGAVATLEEHLTPILEEHGAVGLMTSLELPVQRVLIEMEDAGIAVDRDRFAALSEELGAAVDAAAEDAYAAIDGEEINLSSPKQLQRVLFEDLGMPKTKRTKTGYTTDAEALASLYAKTHHPFLAALLTHRDRIKLKQIVETLRSAIADDGRIHTTFQQTVAATGRLSSTDPNLQNIPARTEDGLRIREAFVCADTYECLLTADYSQIEMRIMAHLSRDESLIEAFRAGEDLHNYVGSRVFDVPITEVSPQMRSKVKAMSYGLAYGLSAFGLSRQLSIDVGEAKDLMEDYFSRFGGVRTYLESVVEQARKRGYTETMQGRRRYLPDLSSDNRQRREMAERAALNAPIQGSAADIIKVAMISVHRALKANNLRSRLLLQVHDELVVEVAPGEVDQVEAIVRDKMAKAAELRVPLEVSVGRGTSWREAAH
ncbi:MAG: DNA polymerase I [Bowdeniella nasicola]|nr:DNA polymerase I [Bowdeniella nasicola]